MDGTYKKIPTCPVFSESLLEKGRSECKCAENISHWVLWQVMHPADNPTKGRDGETSLLKAAISLFPKNQASSKYRALFFFDILLQSASNM